MTPQRGEAGRGLGASRDEAPAPSGILAALILGALLLRLVIVYAFPGAGFKVDIGSFQSWALTLARHGPGGFYDAVAVRSGQVSKRYLSLDQGMIMAALGNALTRDGLREYVSQGAMEEKVRPLMEMEEFSTEPRR